MKKIIIALALLAFSAAASATEETEVSEGVQAIVDAWGVDGVVIMLTTPYKQRPMWFRTWTEHSGCEAFGSSYIYDNCWSRI